jgi:chloramphenicol 3-O-phosphotransferase
MSSTALPGAALGSGVIVVTGIQAAGKSTVGPLLARQFSRSAFIEGDLMWKLIVSGREDMGASPTEEAVRQLRLRYKNGALLAASMAEAGFVAVHADIILGRDLEAYASLVSARPLYIVVLIPDVEAVVERQAGRGGRAYQPWVETMGSLRAAVAEHYRWLEETPRIGLWLDSSKQTPAETVADILSRLPEAAV